MSGKGRETRPTYHLDSVTTNLTLADISDYLLEHIFDIHFLITRYWSAPDFEPLVLIDYFSFIFSLCACNTLII